MVVLRLHQKMNIHHVSSRVLASFLRKACFLDKESKPKSFFMAAMLVSWLVIKSTGKGLCVTKTEPCMMVSG